MLLFMTRPTPGLLSARPSLSPAGRHGPQSNGNLTGAWPCHSCGHSCLGIPVGETALRSCGRLWLAFHGNISLAFSWAYFPFIPWTQFVSISVDPFGSHSCGRILTCIPVDAFLCTCLACIPVDAFLCTCLACIPVNTFGFVPMDTFGFFPEDEYGLYSLFAYTPLPRILVDRSTRHTCEQINVQVPASSSVLHLHEQSSLTFQENRCALLLHIFGKN